jgi:hypothetical protein
MALTPPAKSSSSDQPAPSGADQPQTMGN